MDRRLNVDATMLNASSTKEHVNKVQNVSTLPGNTNWRGRLRTVNLFIKVVKFRNELIQTS